MVVLLDRPKNLQFALKLGGRLLDLEMCLYRYIKILTLKYGSCQIKQVSIQPAKGRCVLAAPLTPKCVILVLCPRLCLRWLGMSTRGHMGLPKDLCLQLKHHHAQ